MKRIRTILIANLNSAWSDWYRNILKALFGNIIFFQKFWWCTPLAIFQPRLWSPITSAWINRFQICFRQFTPMAKLSELCKFGILNLKSIFSWFLSKRVPHVKIETFKANNSKTDRPIQIKLASITHFFKLSKILKFGVEIRKKKIWSFLTGFPSKKSKLSFYAKKVCFQAKVTSHLLTS